MKEFPEKLSTIFSIYTSTSADKLIPLLQDVQDEFGYLSNENILDISKFLKLPASQVYGVATFYNQFRLITPGKFLIQVCRGTACHVKGSEEIFELLKSKLNIEEGQTTADGLFTLEKVRCLGACSIAPVILIGKDFHGKVTPENLMNILKKYGYKE